MRRARWTCAVTTARPSGPGRCPREDRYPRFATARNLVDVVLGRAANGSPGEVGLRTVELLEAAYRSAAKEGQPVGVESDVPAHPRQR
jgi:predicted dehydrogenase